MDINDDELSGLEFSERHNEEEGESWKTKPVMDAAKPLMKLALQILKTTEAIAETIPDRAERTEALMMAEYKVWMTENAMKLSIKISGAMATNDYLLMNENAVIIKLAARELMTQTSGLRMLGYENGDYLDALRSEIDAFKKLFLEWVRTFPKDDPKWPDGWGLFYTEEDVAKWNSMNPDEQVEE